MQFVVSLFDSFSQYILSYRMLAVSLDPNLFLIDSNNEDLTIWKKQKALLKPRNVRSLRGYTYRPKTTFVASDRQGQTAELEISRADAELLHCKTEVLHLFRVFYYILNFILTQKC